MDETRKFPANMDTSPEVLKAVASIGYCAPTYCHFVDRSRALPTKPRLAPISDRDE